MKLQEKSLELNITHELLNLADSWHWFLSEISLWRYWRPRYRLPFFKHPKSSAGGFHITSEGKADPTGTTGGGFDVRIKSGIGGHMLFIQYKMGYLINSSPDPSSIFSKPPYAHFDFKINSKRTDQHFLLRQLATGVGSDKGNAVVYAFPLIADSAEMELHAGNLVRRTKFISIQDIDDQATKNGIVIKTKTLHKFRICKENMDRCEVNEDFFEFHGRDRKPQIIADIIAVNFGKTLRHFFQVASKEFKQYNLDQSYIAEGIQRAYGQYLRHLMHYFEVNPRQLRNRKFIHSHNFMTEYELVEEFSQYPSDKNDVDVMVSVLNALAVYDPLIKDPLKYLNFLEERQEIPIYKPDFLFEIGPDNPLTLNISGNFSQTDIEEISMFKI